MMAGRCGARLPAAGGAGRGSGFRIYTLRPAPRGGKSGPGSIFHRASQNGRGKFGVLGAMAAKFYQFCIRY